jgi:hypothetical protein
MARELAPTRGVDIVRDPRPRVHWRLVRLLGDFAGAVTAAAGGRQSLLHLDNLGGSPDTGHEHVSRSSRRTGSADREDRGRRGRISAMEVG